MIVLQSHWLDAREKTATGRTHLDDAMPRFQFRERHTRHVQGSPEQTWPALFAVTAGEIRFFRTLTWIRRLGRGRAENILNAPPRRPILDVALGSSFIKLAEDPPREIVLGTVVVAPGGADEPLTPEGFRTLGRAGYAKAALSFLVERVPGGSLVTTETRVFATDPATRRRFAAYWRVIYPGSALIRRQWLRAIERRVIASSSIRENAE